MLKISTNFSDDVHFLHAFHLQYDIDVSISIRYYTSKSDYRPIISTDLVDLQKVDKHSDLILRYSVNDLAIVTNEFDEHLSHVQSNISLYHPQRQHSTHMTHDTQLVVNMTFNYVSLLYTVSHKTVPT